MDADELVELPGKRLTDLGSWETGKKMPKTAFPMSKSNSIRLGSKWRRRVFGVDADGAQCLLLVGYHPGKKEFRASFGVRRGEDTVLIGRYEYHESHNPPWHFHGKNGDIEDLIPGIVKGSEVYRRDMPEVNDSFPISDDEALAIAFKFYRIEPDSEFGLTP